MARAVALVTGLPGAPLERVVAALQSWGWDFLWPQQDLGLQGAVSWCEHGVNPEVATMHLDLFTERQHWATEHAPRFYETPYPGPAELLAQFPADAQVVIADVFLCLFWPLWRPHATHLILCDLGVAESAAFIHQRCQERIALDGCQRVAHHYESRLDELRAAWPKPIRVNAAKLTDGTLGEALRVLRWAKPLT